MDEAKRVSRHQEALMIILVSRSNPFYSLAPTKTSTHQTNKSIDSPAAKHKLIVQLYLYSHVSEMSATFHCYSLSDFTASTRRQLSFSRIGKKRTSRNRLKFSSPQNAKPRSSYALFFRMVQLHDISFVRHTIRTFISSLYLSGLVSVPDARGSAADSPQRSPPQAVVH